MRFRDREDPRIRILKDAQEAQEKQLRDTIASNYRLHGYVRKGNEWVKPGQENTTSRGGGWDLFGGLFRRKNPATKKERSFPWWAVWWLAGIFILMEFLAPR